MNLKGYFNKDFFLKHKCSIKRVSFKSTIIVSVIYGTYLYGSYNSDSVYDDIGRRNVRKIISDYNNNGYSSNPISSYNELVADIGDFYKNYLKLDDPNEIYMHFCNMKSYGYFSYDGTYSFGNPIIEINGLTGLSVVLGKGCCRNDAYLFKDVLDYMGYQNYIIGCSLDVKSGISDDNRTDDNYNTSYITYDDNDYYDLNAYLSMPYILKVSTFDKADHVFNAVIYNSQVYYFDTTNMCKWDYIGDDTFKFIPVSYSLINDNVLAYADYSKGYSDLLNSNTKYILSYPCNDDYGLCLDMYCANYLGEYNVFYDFFRKSVGEEVFSNISEIKDYLDEVRRK